MTPLPLLLVKIIATVVAFLKCAMVNVSAVVDINGNIYKIRGYNGK
jgi:hypothetical protein